MLLFDRHGMSLHIHTPLYPRRSPSLFLLILFVSFLAIHLIVSPLIVCRTSSSCFIFLLHLPVPSASSSALFFRFNYFLIYLSTHCSSIYPLCVHVPFSSSLSLSSAFLPCGLFSYFFPTSYIIYVLFLFLRSLSQFFLILFISSSLSI